MTSKILIVEDEPLIADDIAMLLEKQGFDVVDIVAEADDALKVLAEKEVNLALLDINIEGDMDGIGLAALLTIPFIYLTSFYDKATLDRAKLTQPSAYIVKPFNQKDLIANVTMALAKTAQPSQSLSTKPEKWFVKKGGEIVSLSTEQIVYVEAFDNYCTLYTQDDKFIISHTLKSVEAKLIPQGFVRIHRSYLINFESIDSIVEGYVYLKGHQVMLGKTYRKAFMNRLAML